MGLSGHVIRRFVKRPVEFSDLERSWDVELEGQVLWV